MEKRDRSPKTGHSRSTSPLVDLAPEVIFTRRDGITHVTPVAQIPSHAAVAATLSAASSCRVSALAKYDLVRPTTKELMEREQGLIDSLLVRFKNIVELAALPESNVSKEAAAAQSFQIEVETKALIRAAEDLLKLTRELKEMWLFGPIREVGEGQDNAQVDEHAKNVEEMVHNLLSQHAELKANREAAGDTELGDEIQG